MAVQPLECRRPCASLELPLDQPRSKRHKRRDPACILSAKYHEQGSAFSPLAHDLPLRRGRLCRARFQARRTLNSAYLLVAALCTYALGYRFYSKWIAAKALSIENRRATPAEVHDDGKDFVKTNPWIVFGHHFAAISGPDRSWAPCWRRSSGTFPGPSGFSSVACWGAPCRIS